MRTNIMRGKNDVATIYKKNEQTERSEENRLVTTTFVGWRTKAVQCLEKRKQKSWSLFQEKGKDVTKRKKLSGYQEHLTKIKQKLGARIEQSTGAPPQSAGVRCSLTKSRTQSMGKNIQEAKVIETDQETKLPHRVKSQSVHRKEGLVA